MHKIAGSAETAAVQFVRFAHPTELSVTAEIPHRQSGAAVCCFC